MEKLNTRNLCRYIYLLNAKIDHMAEFRTENGTLSREQLYIIEMVAEEPGLTQKVLINRLKREQTSISRAVQKLVDQNYLIKRQNRDDMRASYLEITQQGRDALEELEEEICEMTDDVLEKLDYDEKKALTDILQKIHL
ncbi:MarR family winged helix-turn-helix transcriptional regulator [Salinicoccus hispanicus]|uniref:MarR family transcriptional regulator n=1 Tax=Salinicoccus hispanicus TaxID=157225 RepID=A0A6N8U5N4_9STAP|nr:MarR family transcriptional regulator [Salinicoccus hispanicus]MXQ50919.1 MarR family transcriptional regulator [Salinicoccus hispanicus]